MIALVCGWLLDFLFGDPERLPHPVVYIGRWIAFWEKRLNRGSHRTLKGTLLAVGTIVFSFAVIYAIMHFLPSYLNIALSIILIFFCLAGHTLRHEVKMTFDAVEGSIEEGRTQVARIVGRDTGGLSAQEIRQAALETLAENLSDGVIAPLFWLALLGVPGMFTYKVINTFDSMIGYRSERYRQFGCWAAHIDDIANYIPARITALLILLGARIYLLLLNLCGGVSKGKSARFHIAGWRENISFLLRYGPAHSSPNSGWPEAALAAVLNCQFGGTHNYFGQAVEKPHIGDNPRPLTTADCRISLATALTGEIIAIILTAGFLLVCSW
ncbi:MAG: adenosylcobinamide-phosphate synthase CbiB [Bacteroidaceae bacterium]|nr:adenosylcobinamide-phosphate synthase CbiB [Bacteroidaceae bacterium]